jgi:hypothetical protein
VSAIFTNYSMGELQLMPPTSHIHFVGSGYQSTRMDHESTLWLGRMPVTPIGMPWRASQSADRPLGSYLYLLTQWWRHSLQLIGGQPGSE